MCKVPFNSPGGKPPTEVPGLRPRSPVITVAPVLVTEDPANMAKLEVEATGTVAITVVCIGITMAFSVGSSLLHEVNKTAVAIAAAENMVIIFIFEVVKFPLKRDMSLF